MDEKELDQRIEALANASDKARAQMEMYADVAKLMNLSGVEAKKKILELAGGVEKFNVAFKKSSVDIKKSMDDLKKSIDKGEVSAEELSDQLDNLRNEVNKTSDQSKKQALLDAKADLEAMNARNKAHAALKDSVYSLAGTIGAGVTKAFTGAATTALRGGDSFDVATSMMTAGVDLVNAANQGSANSLKSFGAATAGAGGKVGMAGRAAGIFGEVLGAASTGLSELAKAGIGFMLGQTKQLIAGFQSMSAAGAVYSGGLISMTDTALSAGMTLDQFSKAVTQNRDAFARSGLGVAEGSKRMAAAMQKGGDAARNGMFALGMGLEEQADAYATTMAIMAGPSRKLNASNEQIAAQTQEYAKNMKVLSDLTGEDTKSKQEKLRQDNDTLAFQQILDGKSATEQARINDAMMNMNADQQRAFRENMIYGSVISKDLAIAQATNRGIAEFNTKTFKAAQDGSLSAEQTARLQKDTMQSTHDAAMANKGMAMATSADAQAASAINLRATQYTATFAKSEEERAKIAAEQAAGAKGAGGVAVDLMAQQQEMSIRMQALALTHLDSFSTALEESFKAAMLAVEALGKLANAVEENPLKSLFLSLAGPILSVVAALTQFGPSIFKAFKGTGGVGSAASSYLSKIGGASTVLKGVGLGVVGAAVGTGIQYGGDKLTEAGYEKTGKAVGVAGTATKYAGYGAMIGSVVPGVGTAIGAGIGGVVGAGKGIYDQYYAGNVGSEKLGKATTTATSASGTLKGVTGDQIRSHPNFKKYLAEEESYFPGSPENYASAAERVKEDMIKAQGAKIKTSSANQLTAPKPVAGQMTQNLAAEQTKLYGAVVDPAAAAAKAKAMEKPVASANPAEQQQISLLQSILATMQKNNSISSGILQNSY
jgi:hypothetical protein